MPGPKWTDEELRPLRDAFPILDSIPDHDLPRLWAAIMLKMSTNGLIRAQRSIPGEIAEALVAAYVGGRLAESASQKDVDVVADDERIQVKALRYTDPGRNSVGEFRLGAKGFTRLIIVCFAYDMTPLEAWTVSSAELDDLLTKGSSIAHGRLTLGPRVKARMHRIAAEELLQPRAISDQ